MPILCVYVCICGNCCNMLYYMSLEATQNLSTSAIRFHTILSAAQTTGENEKSTQGNIEYKLHSIGHQG